MYRRIRVALADSDLGLAEAPLPLPPWSADHPVEVEIGYGKGRYLLARAAAEPERGFVGIETALEYYRLARARARRDGLDNVVTLCGEAQYLMATCIQGACADAVHVYFPDPWPKARHQRRRLFDPTTVDLVLGLLRPGGRLYFATDHADYGERVEALLRAHPRLDVQTVDGGWPGGPRTNYEIKYEREGRPIRRLIATREGGPADLVHPLAGSRLVSGV